MRHLLLITALAFAACAPKPSQPAAASPSAASPSEIVIEDSVTLETTAPTAQQPADEASCKAAGGNWKPVCRRQVPRCVTTFPDGQKACSGKADCMGACLVHMSAKPGEKVEGLCAADDDPCGCKQTVEGGKAGQTICVD